MQQDKLTLVARRIRLRPFFDILVTGAAAFVPALALWNLL